MTTSLDDAPLSSFHKRLAAYASGGAFMQGYILSITGVAMVQIAPQLNLSPLQQGLVVGSALVGGLPGAYFGGFLADKFGRQTLYSLVLGLTIVCSIASFWATNLVALIIARLLIGVAVGADWPVAQSLVGEFIPRKHRGRLCLVQLKTARMPRACRGSQSGFGRIPAQVFRFTLRFRRPQQQGRVERAAARRARSLKRGCTGVTVRRAQ